MRTTPCCCPPSRPVVSRSRPRLGRRRRRLGRVRPGGGAQHLELRGSARRVRRLGRASSAAREPGHVITWNTDKSYLRDLERAGLPSSRPSGSTRPATSPRGPFTRASREREFVIKPTVSSGPGTPGATSRTTPTSVDSPSCTHVTAARGAARHGAAVPRQVDTVGETALVYIEGVSATPCARRPCSRALPGRGPAQAGDERPRSHGRGTSGRGPRRRRDPAVVPGAGDSRCSTPGSTSCGTRTARRAARARADGAVVVPRARRRRRRPGRGRDRRASLRV